VTCQPQALSDDAIVGLEAASAQGAKAISEILIHNRPSLSGWRLQHEVGVHCPVSAKYWPRAAPLRALFEQEDALR